MVVAKQNNVDFVSHLNGMPFSARPYLTSIPNTQHPDIQLQVPTCDIQIRVPTLPQIVHNSIFSRLG